MFWFVSVILAVLICGVVGFIGISGWRDEDREERSFRRVMAVVAALVFVIWVGLHTGLTAVKQIEAGHVGVVYQFGEIIDQKGEGLQVIAPWQSIRTESIQVQRQRFDDVVAFSQETQDVIVDATVNYQVSPNAIQELYRNVGPNWFDRLVEPRINQFFKAETVKYSTVEIAPNRELIRINVQEALGADLARFSITITDLLIDDIDFNPEFKAAIERKQIATQDALREQERIEQAKAEAIQNEERARGEANAEIQRALGNAEAEIERARGNAEAILLRANAQAEANRLLDGSLTPNVLQWYAIDKLAPELDVALVPAGTGLLIDPATLLSGDAEATEYPPQP